MVWSHFENLKNLMYMFFVFKYVIFFFQRHHSLFNGKLGGLCIELLTVVFSLFKAIFQLPYKSFHQNHYPLAFL